jgi:hypothetical protein
LDSTDSGHDEPSGSCTKELVTKGRSKGIKPMGCKGAGGNVFSLRKTVIDFHLLGFNGVCTSRLKMETICTSEIFVSTYASTRR